MSIEIIKETNSQLRTILNDDINVLEQLKKNIKEEPNSLLQKVSKANLKAQDSLCLDKKINDLISLDNNPVIICNCGSSDGSNSISKYLLKNHFEKIIAGMCVLAKILNTKEGILYLPANSLSEEMTEKVKAYEEIFCIKLSAGEETLVLRNETALFQALDGKYIRPFFSDSKINEYNGKPALVIDGETACSVFEAINENTFGKLIYIRSKDNLSYIAEVKLGTKLSDLFEELGIETGRLKGILLGDMLGKFITAADLNKIFIENNPLYSSIQIFDDSACMVDETLKVITGSYEQSCGKCVLCREGTTQYKMILGDITKGKGKIEDLDLIKETSEIIKIGTFCEFGRTMIEPVVSSIELFDEEYKDHIRKKKCAASVCKSFLNYYISPADCTGCEECLDACPEDAIEGKDGFIHMIDTDLCTKCDKCRTACPEGAIMIMGAIKPRLPKKLTKVGKFK
ncbi:4Fe-4S binding protein [Clostridium sp. SYSU_GA19001]|uniref:NADH-ubiquinone oxidoreductase-F iron-sulfur binding region domain-containing protein n=1 Tax=Clostridium caldaquaticum TaxID=2940653 RepID=UPI0020774F46|nr:NADH-ubiquinone oxidoreductase-F iron-sulfur binding region domain-containing protein [Clostridium caldaquaticum]MCM8709932.1 4Fe-4S binding protein [Clostridium caldaquaticum]